MKTQNIKGFDISAENKISQNWKTGNIVTSRTTWFATFEDATSAAEQFANDRGDSERRYVVTNEATGEVAFNIGKNAEAVRQ